MKTICVTGATAGIGRESARQLLKLGYRVLVHGRTSDRANRAVDELKSETGSTDIEPVFGDLSQMQEVVTLAQQVRCKCVALDVLLNNAGVYEPQRRLSSDGFEITMAVNHFAHFLLTLKLFDMVSAVGGRVINVSSSAHEKGVFCAGDYSFATELEGYYAYATSKLANVLFTRQLARQRSPIVTAYAVDPGVITTKLLQVGWGTTGDTVAEGARTSVYLATTPGIEPLNGGYFAGCRETIPSSTALDPERAYALFVVSEELLQPYLAVYTNSRVG